VIAQSAPLHDIGKVGIPDCILLQPGKLAPKDWTIMRTYSELGTEALEMFEQRQSDPSNLPVNRCTIFRLELNGFAR
jgi:putative two-component system response regulator